MARRENTLTYKFRVTDIYRQLADYRGKMSHQVKDAMLDAHKDMAEIVQDYAALALKRKRSPRQPRENLLAQSILDPQNRQVYISGFDVGIETWLYKQSPAKRYARRIEEGGNNPMAALGNVIVRFQPGNLAPVRGGGTDPTMKWVRVRHGGKPIKAKDRVERMGGYRMHEQAGRDFVKNINRDEIYRHHFAHRGVADLLDRPQRRAKAG